MQLFDRIADTAAYIRQQIPCAPEVALILGSGLGELADTVETAGHLSYSEVPHFPRSTVGGHEGRLIFGNLGGKEVVMMAGRFHYYEGYSMEEVTFPVRVMKALGARTLIVSNAAGGMNPAYSIGDIVMIRDHINLFPEHPLRGRNDERLGTRFPDMGKPYDHHLIALARQAASELGINVQSGVYAGIQGPTFETPAEYRWLHAIGAELVGMSTVPEVIVALHGGMKVFGASIVTDLGIGEDISPITHEEVLAAAGEAAPRLAALVTELVRRL